MKITNRKILNDKNSLAKISQRVLPIKVSYAIAKNIKKIDNELDIYNSEREKLIDKYCVKNENGEKLVDEDNNLRIAEDNLNDWNKAMQDLLDIEVDVDIHKFNRDDLINSNIEMKPAELMVIDYMMADEI